MSGFGSEWKIGGPEDEEDLVIRVQRGDLSAFERLLDLHGAHLRAFVAMKLPVPHLIDEIAHEAFVFAHRHIHDFRAGTDFGKWLRAIAFNLIRKETLRHQRLSKNREKFLEHHLVQQAVKGEFAPEMPLIAVLEECLARLPEQQRLLLERKYTLSESSREIAHAFGQSEAWVRTTLCRVRTALRQCIETKLNSAPHSAPEPA
ncbi:MAG: sigma-70 family RNA polymerase sigma factor [Verrucomicrobiae bacterium]|nr:sigma-70 family RNA polymerase sigma factor [Verrucomicrobiae bacterium]